MFVNDDHDRQQADIRRQAIQHIVNKPGEEALQDILSGLQLTGTRSKDDIYKDIEQRFLLPKAALPDHWLPTYQVQWEHKLEIPSLLRTALSPPPSKIAFVRTGLDGRITGCVEVPNVEKGTGLTSTSLDRAPAPPSNFVRGKTGHVPFWPGGLDEVLLPEENSGSSSSSRRGLRTIAPGLSRGLHVRGDDVNDREDFVDSLDADDEINLNHTEATEELQFDEVEDSISGAALSGTTEIDDLLPNSRAHLRPVSAPKAKHRRAAAVQKRDWAHVVDINKPMTNFRELVPEMAHQYPFELDTFQKEAVYHLEMGDSVFVAAHTSAGKTVVAEYAIALAGKHMTRAIYTSPIKALSNQKFRDFKQTFSSSSVGILTGDVQINPEANCLVMTTEILRSMLYKGADLIRDVEFVIFDEVHYVNDAERGVVWEEVIIMLPEHVIIILLSATVPNTKEFADWVGRTKKKDIYVISTAKRPVPLEHFLYAGKDTFKIVDSKGQFLTQGYKDAGEALRRKQVKEREAAGLPPLQRLGARAAAPQRGGGRGAAPPRGRGGGGSSGGRSFHQPDKNIYVHLVGHLKKSNLLPVVVFTLSKKRCEENASTLSNVDLLAGGARERSEVHITIEKAISRLSAPDRKLPQIGRMRDLLSRGIGVHHGGLLPLVKELVELLFARGLVKVLFATETFAMGVNMPAKCVVFSGIRKHDGRSFREILPGEYTQMAGRAGRRGLDATGTVIIVVDGELPEQVTLHTMILGKPAKLQSRFRLTYTMILNLLRVEALRVEEMIKRSFSEHATQSLLPETLRRVQEGERTLLGMSKVDCGLCLSSKGGIREYWDVARTLQDVNAQVVERGIASQGQGKVLSTGRVVVLYDEHFRGKAAVLLKPTPNSGEFGILALVDKETKAKKKDVNVQPLPPSWPYNPSEFLPSEGEATYEVTIVTISSIALITNKILRSVDVEAILTRHVIAPMKAVVDELRNLVKTEWIPSGRVPEIDWSRVRTLEFQETLARRESLAAKLGSQSQWQCLSCEDFKHHFSRIHEEMVLREQLSDLKQQMSEENLELIPNYEQRVEVLKELKFVDPVNVTVSLKGRVACEINSADALVLTELILENTLAAYDPAETVALLSAFVFTEKSSANNAEPEPLPTPKLEEGVAAMLAVADRVGSVQERLKIEGEDVYVEGRLGFGLVEVVYEWAKGMPFEQITALTEVPEGTIVRVITRLDEVCREVRDAGRVIGDAGLMKKMEEAQAMIKRDIVFAASLYF
ncbi:translation repressor [Schizopora paradoxa]|uniref:Translation repressor n=1 Tax=Schizopora paradoxa TaxID=27342 RepID=A0A0H2R122_9AGAM|nr:translation repressor [Schizopora paradoxa]